MGKPAVCFEFYKNVYLGSLSALEFDRFSPHALKLLHNATFGRVIEWTEDIRFCVCELTELCAQTEQQSNIASVSDGVTSVSYSGAKETTRRIRNTLDKWLHGHFDITFSGFGGG